MEEKNKDPDSNKVEGQVYVVGPLRLQNTLMRELIVGSLGLKCTCCERSSLSFLDINTGQNLVLLWDCLNIDGADVWEEIAIGSNVNRSHGFLALFNVNPDWGICKEAIRRGVKGVFFENDPPHIFIKGIRSIFNKELWFPRDTLAGCLADSKYLSGPRQEKRCSLTQREKQILLMIASGGTNDKIAEELCISPNTVKTHIHNIFNKIDVPNRLQAAMWTASNL